MLKIINIVVSVISLFIGFFISRKISEADKLKIQVKQFEENQKEQNEILISLLKELKQGYSKKE